MNSITTSGGTPALTMTSREIAELVEARHNDVIATIERLFNKGLLRSSRKSRREVTGGRPINVYDLIERDTHLVVSGYSDEHRARVIDRWQELEAQRAQAVSAIPAAHADHMAAIEIMARMLNASESGKLAMMHAYARHSAPALLPTIPAYAIDAPVIAGQVATSSEVTKSATALLKEAGSALSARAFNALALERGFLAKVTRAGSKGIKEFLVVTDAGLRWGKNVISPQNPRESQPHWYSRSFPALLTELS